MYLLLWWAWFESLLPVFFTGFRAGLTVVMTCKMLYASEKPFFDKEGVRSAVLDGSFLIHT